MIIGMNYFNQALFQSIYGLSHKNFLLDYFGIFCAQYLPYLLVPIFLVIVFYENGSRRKWYLFSEAALAVILSRGLLTEMIRFLYRHSRPFEALHFVSLIPESGSSFPSGHAALFFALAMVIFFRNRKWGIWFFILALVNGLARIYVGVHWPLDILGGIVIGTLSAVFIHWLVRGSREELYADQKN